MNYSFIKKQNGFTLIETILSLSILLTIMYMGYNYIVTGFKSTRFTSEQETAIANARKVLEIFSKEIRGANSSEMGDYPLVKIEDNDFIFYSDINNDNQTERIKYFLASTSLLKVTTLPGPSFDYNQSSSTTTIASYVNNREEPVFSYYDSDYNITNLINDVRLIKINIKINVTPEIAPNDYYVETDVHLRNLKNNL